MKLSIIIPTLNEEKYLPKLLKSISKQTFKDFEIIVVDGNSKDRTKESTNKFKKTLPKLSFYVERKRGAGRQRNVGANYARGKYLLFLDADVELRSNFLMKVLSEFQTNRLDISTCQVYSRSKDKVDKFLYGLVNMLLKLLQETNPRGVGACILIKKDVFHKLKGYNSRLKLGEEHDLIKRAAQKNFKFRVLDNTRIYVSPRRMNEEGRLNLLVKYLYSELYSSVYGKVDKEIVPYFEK